MMEGYYEPHSSLSLSTPLAIVGHPGSGVSQIGRTISGRTGIPFNDVLRSAEATAGRSGGQVVFEQGIAALMDLQSTALQRAVARRPCGVIVVGSALLEDRLRERWLKVNTRVVYVRRPMDVLLARIQRRLQEMPGSFPEFVFGAPGTPEELEQHLANRSEQLEAIDVIFDAEDQHPGRIADAILGELEGLVPLERSNA